MSNTPAPDKDPDTSKRIVKVLVRVLFKSGCSLYFRKIDVNEAHTHVKYMARLMFETATGRNPNPMFESLINKDEFVSFKYVPNSAMRHEPLTTTGFGKTAMYTASMDMREVAAVAVVCPSCMTVVEDSLPGHFIDEDGECHDHLTEGSR